MRQHYLNNGDFKRRLGFISVEKFQLLLRSIVKDRRLSFFLRYVIRSKYYYYKRPQSVTSIKNRCLVTGRNRFILRYLHMSRMTFREGVCVSRLSGFKKF